MTINGGKPHQVGYSGQRYRIVLDCDEKGPARTIAWSNTPAPEDVLRSLETRPGWSNARVEEVPCAWCGQHPIRDVLDGDPLCQSCCNQWCKGEQAAADETT